MKGLKGLDGSVVIYLVCVVSLGTAAALEITPAHINGTQTAGDVEEVKTPAVLTTLSQIIAREGNCILIDCNVTGEPFPKVQWFNSHGHLLDTEASGRLLVTKHTMPNHFHILKMKRAEHGLNLPCFMSQVTCVSV